ncbi:unnamed protein product [Caenorhabditis auriculariae]|uniref:Uncharacterized protein n=1 Tax=Caenorhabditis auriculariae TaxID=2777116 RepID=A0A8S1HH01_9PELO|nr:unnamed protein product [Caenorhabditis auriculariae]
MSSIQEEQKPKSSEQTSSTRSSSSSFSDVQPEVSTEQKISARNFFAQKAENEAPEEVDDGFVRVGRNRTNTADTNIYMTGRGGERRPSFVLTFNNDSELQLQDDVVDQDRDRRRRQWNDFVPTSSYGNRRAFNFPSFM